MSVLSDFGQRIRQLRAKQGWSQEEFAARCGLHRTYVSGVERGGRNPTLTVLFKLAHGLGMPLSNIVEGLHDEE